MAIDTDKLELKIDQLKQIRKAADLVSQADSIIEDLDIDELTFVLNGEDTTIDIATDVFNNASSTYHFADDMIAELEAKEAMQAGGVLKRSK